MRPPQHVGHDVESVGESCFVANQSIILMNILLLGSGGREHALAWKIAQSSRVEKLYIAPGNAGTVAQGGREHALAWKIAQSEKCDTLYIAPGNAGTEGINGKSVNVAIKADDFEAIKSFAVEKQVSMVVVGPEDPLVKGIYDDFAADERTRDIPVIGPSKAGAVLEGSKDFAKAFMRRHDIPTAAYETFDGEHLEDGLRFLKTLKAPYVLKADGLCAGKGVLIANAPRGRARAEGDAWRHVWQCVVACRHRGVPLRYRVLSICHDRRKELQDSTRGKRL